MLGLPKQHPYKAVIPANLKIGIFGDSYASLECIEINKNKFYGWSGQLLNLHQNCEILASPGTSLEYSVDLFEQYHQKFDKIIFVTTSYPRTYTPVTVLNKLENKTRTFYFWNSLEQCKVIQDNYIDAKGIIKSIEQIESIKQSDPISKKYDALSYRSLVHYILNLRPDTVLIPGCTLGNNHEMWRRLGYKWCLSYITLHECENIEHDLKTGIAEWMNDHRPNHLSLENNAWVLEHILSRLNGRFIDWKHSTSFQFKNKDEFKTYQN